MSHLAPNVTTSVRLPGPMSNISSVAFHANGTELIVSDYGTVALWRLAPLEIVRQIETDAVITSMGVDPNGARVAIGTEDGEVIMVDLQKGTTETLLGGIGPVFAICFSARGETLAISSESDTSANGYTARPTVRLWDTNHHREVYNHSRPDGYGHGLAFGGNGHLTTSGNFSGSIEILAADGRIRVVETNHQGGINSIDYSPSGNLIATGSVDSTAHVWDPRTGELVHKVEPHGHYVQTLSFSPDGRILAVGTVDPSVQIWDATNGRKIATLLGHSDGITSMAFSPNGVSLATGSMDSTVRIWDFSRLLTA